jgi:hypothetical protein
MLSSILEQQAQQLRFSVGKFDLPVLALCYHASFILYTLYPLDKRLMPFMDRQALFMMNPVCLEAHVLKEPVNAGIIPDNLTMDA